MSAVELTITEAVATVTLNRPQAMNAMNDEMAIGLRDICKGLSTNEDARCVVIQGAGDHFMAGGDIVYFAESLKLDDQTRQKQIEGLVSVAHEAIACIRQMPKPVIASVRGSVAGFGMSLMSACDLVIAADSTVFAQAYCQLGVTPDGGNSYFLPRMIGEKRAKELTFLGDRIDAQTAERFGLINRVVDLQALPDETAELSGRLARGSAQSIAGAKALFNASLEQNLDEQLSAEQNSFLQRVVSSDFAEGVMAFVQKRVPEFK